jgi:uncharacterized membrane protein (TIGR02234 family)
MTPRRTFGPVVLLGLASAALTAVAAAKPWAALDGTTLVPHTVAEAGRSPLAAALSLVLLAAWGVVLVTRGRVRRGAAVLGLLAALGVLLCVVADRDVPDRLMHAVLDSPHSGGVATAGLTGWWWVALVGAIVSVVATAAAVLWAPAWPTMSRKYDAPGSGPEEPVAAESADSLDLWKSMDEGHDPTR